MIIPWFFVVSSLLVLVIDLVVFPGTAIWLLYAAPIYTARGWMSGRYCTVVLYSSSVLIVLGGLLAGPEAEWSKELLSRGIGLVVLWGVAHLPLATKQQGDASDLPDGTTICSDTRLKEWIRSEAGVLWLMTEKPPPSTADPGIVTTAGELKRHLSWTCAQAFRPNWELLSRWLVISEDQARRRISHQLHDDIAQMLAAVGMQLHVASRGVGEDVRTRLGECLCIVEQASKSVREMASALHPTGLDDFGLAPILQRMARAYTGQGGPAIRVSVASTVERMPSDVETACFRIAEEAVLNAIRHAGAREIRIALEQNSDRVELEIADDGIGFDPDRLGVDSPQSPGSGISMLHARTRLLGGQCTIRSAPGQGTEIRVAIPLGRTARRE